MEPRLPRGGGFDEPLTEGQRQPLGVPFGHLFGTLSEDPGFLDFCYSSEAKTLFRDPGAPVFPRFSQFFSKRGTRSIQNETIKRLCIFLNFFRIFFIFFKVFNFSQEALFTSYPSIDTINMPQFEWIQAYLLHMAFQPLL